MRYAFDGVPQTATLGKFNVMSLAAARAAADEKRTLAENGEHLTVLNGQA